MAQYPVTKEDGTVVNVESATKPSLEEAASLVAAQEAQAPAASEAPTESKGMVARAGELGAGEIAGSVGGAMIGGPPGAGLGAMVGATGDSLAQGAGVPSIMSLLKTGAVNATGEKAGQLLLKGAGKLVQSHGFQEGASSIMDLLRHKPSAAPIGAGNLLRSQLEGGVIPRVAKKSTELYKKLTDAAEAAGVRIQNPNKLVDMAAHMTLELRNMEHVFPAKAKETIKLLEKVSAFANKTPDFNDYWSFYRQLQHEFKSYAKLAGSPLLEDKAQRAILQQANADLNAAIKDTPMEKLRSVADTHFRTVDKPLEKLVRDKLYSSYEEPSLMIRHLMEPGHPSRFRAFGQVANKAEKQTVREAWMRQTIQEATNPNTGAISAGKFGAAWHGLDESTRGMLFDGSQREYKKIFDTLASATLHEKFMGETGGAIRGFAPSIIMVHSAYAFTKGNIIEGLKSAAAAGGLASVLSSPKIARAMVKGLNLAPGSKAAIRVGQHIASAITSTAADQLLLQPSVSAQDTSAQQGPQDSLAGQ